MNPTRTFESGDKIERKSGVKGIILARCCKNEKYVLKFSYN